MTSAVRQMNIVVKSSIQPVKIFSNAVHAPAERVGRFCTEKGKLVLSKRLFIQVGILSKKNISSACAI